MAFIAETCNVYFVLLLHFIAFHFIYHENSRKNRNGSQVEDPFHCMAKTAIQIVLFSGVKVFELSLSSVTYKHRCVLRACMHASVHMCTFCYIVLVCFPSLTHAIHYLLSFTHLHTNEIDCRWRFDLLRALKCLPHTYVCVCVRVHVFYYQNRLSWLNHLENMNGASRVSAHTYAGAHTQT